MAFLPAMQFEALNLQAFTAAPAQLPAWQRPRGRPRGESTLRAALVTGCLVGNRQPHGRRLASDRTELLVDGDSISVERVEEAARCLQDRVQTPVRATVFAKPALAKLKKWGELFDKPGFRFQPVRGLKDLSKEPTDDALISAMTKLSSDSTVKDVALLTQDVGFLHVALQLQNRKSFRVLIPENERRVIRRYEKEAWFWRLLYIYSDMLWSFVCCLAWAISYLAYCFAWG